MNGTLKATGAFPRLLVFLCLALARPADGKTVWDGYDPEKPSLDVETVRTHVEDGVEIQVLRYTSLIWEGRPIRILGMYGRPRGRGRFPAVLHFHGKGGTVSPKAVAHFVKRGYACFSFDWTGPRKGRAEFTEWPPSVSPVYTADKRTHMYHAIIAARRAITFLRHRSEVDGDRIGAYGISYGGYFSWILNGTDPRLRACVHVYGCGGVLEKGHTSRHHLGEVQDRLEEWAESYEPLRYGPRQLSPVLYVGSSNDFFGWPTVAERALAGCKRPKRRVYSIGTNHNVSPETARTAFAWLDHYLKGAEALPESPTLQIKIGSDGVLRAAARAADTRAVEYVRIDYSIGDADSPGRCWRSVKAEKARAGYSARLPIFDPAQQLQAMAYVKYRAGYGLHSAMVELVPSRLGPVRATLKPTNYISDFSDGLSGWATAYRVGLCGPPPAVRLELAPAPFKGRRCLRIVALKEGRRSFSVACRRLGDPQCSGGDAQGFSLWVRGAAGKLHLAVAENYGRIGWTRYKAEVAVGENKGWQKLIIRRDRFKSTGRKKSPSSWRKVQYLAIRGRAAAGESVEIGPLEWLR